MDKRQAQRILQEVKKRQERRDKLDLTKLLFPEQLAFLQDPEKRKAAVCSRRAGKSTAAAIYMLTEAMQYEYALIPYVTLTRRQAKNIMWPAFQRINKQLDLDLQFNRHDLTITCPNGSQIQLNGADGEDEIERLRGPGYPLIVVDECQSFRPFLKEMMQDILEPALMDYDGTLIMTGTPCATLTGFFYEITGQESEWSVHHWTVLDNPFMPNAANFLARQKKTYGWTDDTPRYMREYRGLWVKDEDSLVYHLRDNVSLSGDRLLHEPRFVLAMDLGYNDTKRKGGTVSGSTAFAIFQYDEYSRRCHLLKSWKMSNMIPSAVAAEVEKLNAQYQFAHIVADSGGLGKGYVEEMRQRWGLNIEAADKGKKRAYIELLNGDLASGVLTIDPEGNTELLAEVAVLQWDEERKGPDKSRYHDHLCDAMLYGWRACKQYLAEDSQVPPLPTDKGYHDYIAAQMEQQEVERFERAKSSPFWAETAEDPSDDFYGL